MELVFKVTKPFKYFISPSKCPMLQVFAVCWRVAVKLGVELPLYVICVLQQCPRNDATAAAQFHHV